MIVRLDITDGEAKDVKRVLSKIGGVRGVEFNNLSGKLTISHDGSEQCVRMIGKALDPWKVKARKSS